jgi:hypothetical protein
MHLHAEAYKLFDVWDGLPARLQQIKLDAVVVMPNYVHGIT